MRRRRFLFGAGALLLVAPLELASRPPEPPGQAKRLPTPTPAPTPTATPAASQNYGEGDYGTGVYGGI